jgi:hypothetical protein
MRAAPEYRLQKAVVQHLTLRPAPNMYFCAIPNGGGRSSARTGAFLKAMGLRAGAPDIVLVVEGKAHGLELKATKGRLSPAQKQAANEWEAAGGSFHVASSIDAALDILTGIGAIYPDSGASRKLREIESQSAPKQE